MLETTEPVIEQAVSGESYSEILRSSALVGGSSVISIAIGIVRTKVIAILLGPAGFGLFGVLGSIANLFQCLAGMGVNSSGVRQIAYATGSGDSAQIAQTATALRRTSILLGVFGAVLLFLLSRPVSRLTFGGEQYAHAISFLSIAVFFQVLSNGQAALIQGMRRIVDFAKNAIFGAFFGTLLAITFIYLLRERGIVPALAGIAAASLFFSWWYSKKVEIEPHHISNSQVLQQVPVLLKLGFAFMVSGFATTGMAYFARVIVLHDVGFEATGMYQAAWTLGGIYVGFILQTMGADFFPRLTASIENDALCNRLVNEQTEIGLLLAGPGVIASIALAPFLISLFYSTKFGDAAGILRWFSVGAILQVATWPMSYIIVAKGRQAVYLASELAWGITNFVLTWGCVRFLGLSGAGVAFVGSYVAYGIMLLPIARRLSDFRFSSANKKIAAVFLVSIAVVFSGFYVFPFGLAASIGTLAAVLSSVYSVRVLATLIPRERIPEAIRRTLLRFDVLLGKFR